MPLPEDFYQPPVLFRNPHLHTIFPVLFRKVPCVEYERYRLETSDGDFTDLDFLKREGSETLLLLLHGLEGSSRSKYIRAMAALAAKNGMDAAAMNLKGCSGEANRKPGSYHSGKTDDLHEILLWLEENTSYKKVLLAGFSLGGNIVLKYLGEYADLVPSCVRAAAAVSVPCHLAGAAALAKAENRCYMNTFLKTLKQKALFKIEKFNLSMEISTIKRAKNFFDFDNAYTAPVHGFRNAEEYWKKSSSLHYLNAIERPVLLINALDDPFLSPSCFPFAEAQKSNYLHLLATRYGGHLGFSGKFPVSGTYWHEDRIFSFFHQLL
jgi:predicted alpha/beta-fold hydrolase